MLAIDRALMSVGADPVPALTVHDVLSAPPLISITRREATLD
jgi:hypothetical protein